MASQVEDATVGVGGLDITIEGSTCVYDFLCFLFFFGSRGELFVVGIFWVKWERGYLVEYSQIPH